MRAAEPAGMEDLALAQRCSAVGCGPWLQLPLGACAPTLGFWQHGFTNMSVGASRMAAWRRWWRRATSSKLLSRRGRARAVVSLPGREPIAVGVGTWVSRLRKDGLLWKDKSVACLWWLAHDASLMNAGCDEARVTRCSNKTRPAQVLLLNYHLRPSGVACH
jgi:hypothetical protein